MAENPKPPSSSSNPHLPRRSRPRVREVSSRFMSPATSTPKQPPSTPFESKIHSSRRSQTDLRHRFADENRPDSLNRRSLSPVRSIKPRSAVKLFKDSSRTDTPAPAQTPMTGRILRQRNFDTAAAKILKINTNYNHSCNSSLGDDSSDELSSIDGDCESVKSEPCEIGHNSSNGSVVRFSTPKPCSRSMELPLSSHEYNVNGTSTHRGGVNEEKGVNSMMKGSVKVARGLNLPPMAPLHGGAKGIGAVEVKKAVRKGSGQAEDVHRLRLLYNRYLQWRYANAKAEASMMAKKKQCEKQLYSLAVKLPELRESVKSKRIEYCLLKGLSTLSTILDAQMPYLDEWSILDESFSSSLMELSNGLLNVLSQLPLDGNVRADTKEIEEELHSALKATELICLHVQSFMPKAEHVDSLMSDLARVSSGEIRLIDECGDLLSKTHLSQVEECNLRGQLMQLHKYKLKDGQR
ncbi:protein ENDOSPERM DEFECTIVE 1-like [Silene latifolia]|uniref:protein ENDOSPERM DEFECTIVE 1-like n=1 Tax=Silene latifolia TaxID=37657 RepID=UPI003D786F1B